MGLNTLIPTALAAQDAIDFLFPVPVGWYGSGFCLERIVPEVRYDCTPLARGMQPVWWCSYIGCWLD
eukprot:2375434-Prymnesium_polylepis.1